MFLLYPSVGIIIWSKRKVCKSSSVSHIFVDNGPSIYKYTYTTGAERMCCTIYFTKTNPTVGLVLRRWCTHYKQTNKKITFLKDTPLTYLHIIYVFEVVNLVQHSAPRPIHEGMYRKMWKWKWERNRICFECASLLWHWREKFLCFYRIMRGETKYAWTQSWMKAIRL